MTRSDNSSFEKIDGFRIYASHQVDEIDGRMRINAEEAQAYARRVFRDIDAVNALFYAVESGNLSEYRVAQIADTLQQDPAEFGKLRGLWFSPKTSRLVQPSVEKLAEGLREQSELVVVRARYHELCQRAISATRLEPRLWPDVLQDLEHERDYCDSTRNVRLQNRALATMHRTR